MRANRKEVFEFLRDEFIYGGHLQCLGFAGVAFIASYLLNLRPDWKFFLAVYLIFYPIYVYDRRKGVKEDEATNIQRTSHFKKYFQKISLLFYFAIFLLLFVLFLSHNLTFAFYSIVLLLLGLLYPIFMKGLTRKIIGYKNFYVAAFFAAICLAPLLYFHNSFSLVLISSFILFVYLSALKMQVFLDVKDLSVDKEKGLLTVPALLGREKSFLFLELAILLNLLLLILFVFFHIFPPFMLVLLFVFLYNFYCLKLIKKGNYLGYILESGEFFLWAILVFMDTRLRV